MALHRRLQGHFVDHDLLPQPPQTDVEGTHQVSAGAILLQVLQEKQD